MSREIKYELWSDRYWIEFKKWMLKVKSINLKTKVASCYKEEWDFIPVHFDWEYKEWNLREYTWLKDKNWVEIYEGDIVKILYTDYTSVDNFHIWKIVWDIYSYWIYFWEHKMWWDDIWRITTWPHWYIEIIWNIYETPNLLNN